MAPHALFLRRALSLTKTRLIWWKRLARLAYLPWTCIMAGDGEQLETVRALVERHGLEKRIHLPGWVSPEQVLEHFAASDILVLPSRSEGCRWSGCRAWQWGWPWC